MHLLLHSSICDLSNTISHYPLGSLCCLRCTHSPYLIALLLEIVRMLNTTRMTATSCPPKIESRTTHHPHHLHSHGKASSPSRRHKQPPNKPQSLKGFILPLCCLTLPSLSPIHHRNHHKHIRFHHPLWNTHRLSQSSLWSIFIRVLILRILQFPHCYSFEFQASESISQFVWPSASSKRQRAVEPCIRHSKVITISVRLLKF